MTIDPCVLVRGTAAAKSLSDGSVRLVLSAKPEVKELLTLRSLYSNRYELTVHNEPALITAVIIVSRTSVNCWRLIICKDSVEIITVKTLTETNKLLSKHLKE